MFPCDLKGSIHQITLRINTAVCGSFANLSQFQVTGLVSGHCFGFWVGMVQCPAFWWSPLWTARESFPTHYSLPRQLHTICPAPNGKQPMQISVKRVREPKRDIYFCPNWMTKLGLMLSMCINTMQLSCVFYSLCLFALCVSVAGLQSCKWLHSPTRIKLDPTGHVSFIQLSLFILHYLGGRINSHCFPSLWCSWVCWGF